MYLAHQVAVANLMVKLHLPSPYWHILPHAGKMLHLAGQNKPVSWIKIAESPEELPFNSNNLAEVDADGKTICIGKHEGRLFAFARKCPHASGLMVQGWIDPMGNVVCPLHRYKFCMANGRNVSGEGYHLKHWPVAVREDGVWVELKENNLLGMLGFK